jgi:hypothetical protein
MTTHGNVFLNRVELGALAERCEARATSLILKDRPELQRDMRLCAGFIRAALADGYPVSHVEIDMNGGR